MKTMVVAMMLDEYDGVDDDDGDGDGDECL